ncbi:uncharacterized protein LOC114656771 [Erpetoichthys calabaricus]|uniref:uncharacterized protein LOC114656771 n=1 Tax=Erpetoichthys calabaricus TaxID=27687 RepID=UPI0010A00E99|nr:uncharacterized protein LOC114656771 [Erpetoichthys calabaricus]
MDQLYSALQTEVTAFKQHVQQCKDNFDLDTLHTVLISLTENNHQKIESLDALRHLAEVSNFREQAVQIQFEGKANIQSYISWFFTYLDHLRSLKEIFDEKVVIPLCENIYVNDEEEALETQHHSPYSQQFSSFTLSENLKHDSIAKVANDLFSLRRKWTALLTTGKIKEEYLNIQSAPKHIKENKPIDTILWLVSDLFYKCFLAANLASHWIHLHQRKYSSASHWQVKLDTDNRKMKQKSHQFKSIQTALRLPKRTNNKTQIETAEEIKNKLRDARFNLLALMWRDKRIKILEKKMRESLLNSQNLQHLLEKKKNEMDLLQHKAEMEVKDGSKMKLLNEKYSKATLEAHILEKNVRLEEYHQRLLKRDWILELEMQPTFIRYIDMLQELCKENEEKLKNKGEEFSQEPQQCSLMSSLDSFSILSCSSSTLSLK